MLTSVIFIPSVGSLLLLLVGKNPRISRLVALFFVILELILVLILFVTFDRSTTGYSFIERANWIPLFNIQYLLAVDGLSVSLVFLNAILGVVAVLISWTITEKVREYFALLLLLQTAVMGVFISMDMFLFFVFWELELIPMYFLIAKWGSGRKEYSAMKVLLFTLIGSAFMFISIIALYLSQPVADRTLDMMILAERDISGLIPYAGLISIGFLVAFAVKLPIFPFHTWLPDAHTDAPTAISVMLAGVLLKMGGYGLIRINAGLFPEQLSDLAPLLAIAAVINVLYGAFIVVRQTDIKRLIAYSSVSHMGFVVLGLSSFGGSVISTTAINGAALQLFSHGIITALLFVCAGLIYERTHTRYIPDMGGLIARMPLIGIGFIVAGLASLGLPSTSGFVAEILIFLGAYNTYPLATALCAFGVVLAAGYMLWAIQRTLFGPSLKRWADLNDASSSGKWAIVLLLIPVMVIGIYPKILLDVLENSLLRIVGGLA